LRPTAVVGIGASAGGLPAFQALLRALPSDTGLAFVVLSHLVPDYTSMLAEILSRDTAMPVTEVRDEPQVEANRVYVIPPGREMVITAGSLHLEGERGRQRRPIDRFLETLAQDRAESAIGVILSGTGSDGTLGLAAIKAAGGVTFAQDDSAQQTGMPQSAVNAGCVDRVMSPANIAAEIARVGQRLADAARAAESDPREQVDRVIAALHTRLGVDFAEYKPTTLQRRIRRRMLLHKIDTLEDYASFIEHDPGEGQLLYQDVLIGVTAFFRNPAAFETLAQRVMPELFVNRSRDEPLRAWVLGCSTGEEAYSVAIVLKEAAAQARCTAPIVVYATDLNGAAIDKARKGVYPSGIDVAVSPERLRRFFVQQRDGSFRVTQELRDLCVFARHDALHDPPFSRLDLITCRNVLIYMEPPLQRRLLPMLHYALKPGGFLFLGPSESISGAADLFEGFDPSSKLFRRKPVQPLSARVPRLTGRFTAPADAGRAVAASASRSGNEAEVVADRALLAEYAPPGVLVDAALEVQQFQGDTAPFLAPAQGKASLNLMKMLREPLLVPMRAALQRARKGGAAVRKEGIDLGGEEPRRRIALKVIPVRQPNLPDHCYWVMFEPEVEPVRPADPVDATDADGGAAHHSAARARAGDGDALAGRAGAPARPGTRAAKGRTLADKDARILTLERELAATREALQSVIEQQETSSRELQTAAEEVQTANEELQSINEELQTSNEEIQSTNEELTTVNEELTTVNEELSRASNDLNNIFSSVQMAIVMVWPDLRIRRFTSVAGTLLKLIETDIGRPIGDIRPNFDGPDLPQLLQQVIETRRLQDLEVRDGTGRWYLLRVRPYVTVEERVDGAVLVFVDIDRLKQNQQLLEWQARLLEQAHEPIVSRNVDGTIGYWNRGAERLYGYASTEALGRPIESLLATELPESRQSIDATLQRDGFWTGEVVQTTRDGRRLVVESMQVLIGEHGSGRHVIVDSHRDVTERKALEESLQLRVRQLADADRRRTEFLAMLAHELRNPLAPLRNAVQVLRHPGADAETVKRSHVLIERQVATMTRLVEDLLDAARVARGLVQLRREGMDLGACLQRACETARPLIEARGHGFTIALPPMRVRCEADSTRLEQVFVNLLANAAKFTPEHGEVRVSLNVRRRESDPAQVEAVVSVQDTGVGIPPELLPRVFDLFAQGDQTLARAQGGLGIGLSLVRELVALHGGRVSADSAGVGCGSEFCVYLPVVSVEERREAAASRSAAHEIPRAQHPQRVLVVDDNPDIVESAAMLLGGAGHEVATALSGQDALKAAEHFRPGVALLDIGMPDLDGYEIARRLRKIPGLEKLPLVAVSGYGSPADRERSRAAGFDHHCVKPLDFAVLSALLEQIATRDPSVDAKAASTE
jgi:two-component system CheB/CheR fusion protein